MKAKTSLSAAIIALCVVTTVFAQTSMDTDVLAIVELVKKEIVPLSKFKANVQQLEKVMRRATTIEERRKLLDSQIEGMLVLQAAEGAGITVSDAELNDRIRKYTAKMNNNVPLTDQQLAELAKKDGTTLEEFKANFKKNMIIEKYVFSVKGKELEAINSLDKFPNPSEAEIQAYYEGHKSEFVRPESIVISMIAVDFNEMPEEVRAKKRALLQNIKKEIGNDGNAFARYLAAGTQKGAEYISFENQPVSKADKLVPIRFGETFANTVFKTSVGDIVYIESEKGCFVVRVSDRIPEKQLTLADYMAANMSVRTYIILKIKTDRQAAEFEKIRVDIVNDLRSRAKITIFENKLIF
jgi:parvulin-like peptidyl-prolyl isomerase